MNEHAARGSWVRALLGTVPRYAILMFALLFALGPVCWAVTASFRPSSDVLTDVFGNPFPPSLTGYRDAIRQVDLLTYVANTFIYAAAAAVLCPLVALLLAYPCARQRFPMRSTINILIAAGIAVPGICLITPEFFIMLRLGLLDTKHGMVIFYVAILLPISFVILRAFLLSVPREVEEAAALDGASYYRILFGIVAPIVMPAITTVAIIVFISVWNDFLWNLLLAPGFENRNTQVALASFKGQFKFNISALLAGTTIVLAIPVTIFLFAQRLTLTGLTGLGGRSASPTRRDSDDRRSG